MNEEKNMPVVHSEEATAEQREYLESIGKWKNGLSKEEASVLIESNPPDYVTENQMLPGLHLVTIDKIMDFTDENGKPKKDKDGHPGIRIIFINKDKKTISDIFYYSMNKNDKCASEWKLRKLKAAMGLSAEKSQNAKEYKSKEIYLVVQKVDLIDKNTGEIFTDHEGNPKWRSQATSNYYACVEGKSKPIIEGDPEYNNGNPSGIFYGTKEVTPKNNSRGNQKAQPKTQPSQPASVNSVNSAKEEKKPIDNYDGNDGW